MERWVWLRLKLIADIGIVGLPNAGKSTLLARVTSAKPKIADYPFTTLAPALGVVRHKGREFVLADIPGLIEGAHLGAGLGHRFLGHVERCRALIHLVDAAGDDPLGAHRTVRGELAAYAHGLDEKPEFVVLSRADLAEKAALKSAKAKLRRRAGREPLVISAATGEGIEALLDACLPLLDQAEPKAAARNPRRRGT
jgi:GTP-binding protein